MSVKPWLAATHRMGAWFRYSVRTFGLAPDSSTKRLTWQRDRVVICVLSSADGDVDTYIQEWILYVIMREHPENPFFAANTKRWLLVRVELHTDTEAWRVFYPEYFLKFSPLLWKCLSKICDDSAVPSDQVISPIQPHPHPTFPPTDLDIGRVEVVLRHQGGAEVVARERHPVGLHVTWREAALLGDALVDVRLEDVVSELDGFVRAQRRVYPTHLKRQVGVPVSVTVRKRQM